MVEHSAVNRVVVGSSPTWGVQEFRKRAGDARKEIPQGRRRSEKLTGSMVKRLRHRPFTAVTRVRFPLESLLVLYFGAIAKWYGPGLQHRYPPVQIRLAPLNHFTKNP